MLNKVLLVVIGAITIACGKEAEARSGLGQPCRDKLSGAWEFGRAPNGCTLTSSQNNDLEEKYKEIVYDENKSKTTEVKRYTTDMYSFLTDFATAYYKRREPSATDADVTAWNRLILTTAHQEGYWSQYRIGKDNLFRFFRGDGGHGYGMMQVDDRWHKQFILSNKVFDLSQHLVYSMDMLYDLRKKAKRKPCSGKTDAASINRTAWSAYNGGPASKCRWTRSSRWSRNDKGFWEKYQNQSWEQIIATN